MLNSAEFRAFKFDPKARGTVAPGSLFKYMDLATALKPAARERASYVLGFSTLDNEMLWARHS
jgi:hypothetical protein